MFLKRLFIFLGVIIFICSFSLRGEAFNAGVPKANLATLSRGVSIYGWFNGADVDKPNHLDTFITSKDIDKIKAAGLSHIRLPIEPVFFMGDATRLKELDKAVHLILADGLGVVIDIHSDPNTGFNKQLCESDAALNNLVHFWSVLAARYAALPSDKVFFETLNEPQFHQYDPTHGEKRWNEVQNRLIAAIRHEAPKNTIIVKGYDWDSADSLIKTKALPDKNLVYSFHFYEPMEFTHQGVDWWGGSPPSPIEGMRQIPYPPDAQRCKQALAASLPSSASAIQAYCDSYNPQNTLQKFARVAQWAKSQGVPLYLGEFGVYIRYSPLSDRARWIHDTEAAAEKFGISWARWDYNGNFAMF